jgi:hypothetical protein
VRLDHLLSKEHLTAAPRGDVVYVVSVSVRLTHGKLISGALATRFGGIADRQVPPTLFEAWEWERRFRGSSVPDTLLGPEETGRFGAAAVGWRPRGLLAPVGGWAPLFLVCGTTLPSHRLIFSLVERWVSGDGVELVAVCCLRFA